MNKFEENFFLKYIPEWQEIKWVIHIHWLDIIGKIFLWLSLWLFIPSYLYILSQRVQDIIPFYILESLLIIVFIKIIYDIFDWYNDVWIITNEWVVSLERALLKTTTQTLWFSNIEWLEVEKKWILDTLFQKWDLIIHKIWSDTFILKNANKPYKSIDLIEQIEAEREETLDEHDDRFSLIMDALWWVVENFLDKKETETQKVKNHIQEYEYDKDSIDLR